MKPRNEKIDIFHFNLICELNELPHPPTADKGKNEGEAL